MAADDQTACWDRDPADSSCISAARSTSFTFRRHGRDETAQRLLTLELDAWRTYLSLRPERP